MSSCVECKAPLPLDTSNLHHACYDCHIEEDAPEMHTYVCSAECRKRVDCRQGQCDHWSMYDCKEFLGIPSGATDEEIAADRAEKYARKAEYEARILSIEPPVHDKAQFQACPPPPSSPVCGPQQQEQ